MTLRLPACDDCLDSGIDLAYAAAETSPPCPKKCDAVACNRTGQWIHSGPTRKAPTRLEPLDARKGSPMLDTSQGAVSPAAAPTRKKNVRPVGRPPRSPDVLVAAGAMIRERRESLDMSMRRLAELTERSHGYIGDVERGACSICFDLAERFAVVLGLDLAVILCAFRVVPEHAAAAFFDVDRMRAALAGAQR